MRRPVCTIDTSSVIALDRLDLLPQLSFLFSRVLLPRGVRAELFRRRISKDRIRAMLNSYAFIERCNNYDQGTVAIVLIERRAARVEDRGEAEAVVQATELGATVIVDDAWGRALAERLSREVHGTFWVLQRFFELGLASATVTRNRFIALLKEGVRLPWPEVNEFLARIGVDQIVIKG